MNKLYMKIDGIFCDHCKEVITKALMQDSTVQEVKIKNDIACMSCNGKPNYNKLIKRINDLGYRTKREYISDKQGKLRQGVRLPEFLIILFAILLFAWGLYRIFGYNIFNVIPTINSSITYGMLIVTGLFTSIHCISMCGAINLTAVFGEKGRSFLQPVLYNAGRLLSYTLIGCAVGAVGSVLSINAKVSGIIIIIAAGLMFLMALKMLGILDFPSVKCFHFASGGKRNAFIIGILNGFMPCGPLQAMQLYALSTGSALTGGLSMFLFGLGTVPLMLSMGVLVNVMKGSWRIWINKVASVLILVLSISMLNRGLLSVGVNIQGVFSANESYDNYISAVMDGERQTVETDLYYNSYGDIVVQKGIPVELHIYADEKYLTGCNEEVLLNDFGIDLKLVPGDNVIEFTPTEEGEYTYSCWMYMISNTIKVIDNIDYFEGK